MLVLQVSTADALVAHLGVAQQTNLRQLHAHTVHGQAPIEASAGAIVLRAASHAHCQQSVHSAGAGTQSLRFQPSGSPVAETENAYCAACASSERLKPGAAGHSADQPAVHSGAATPERSLLTSVPAYRGSCNDQSIASTAVNQGHLASSPGASGPAGVSAAEVTAAAVHAGAPTAAAASEESAASADGAAALSNAARVRAGLHRAASAAAAVVANPAEAAGGQGSLPCELSSSTLLVADGRDRSAAAASRSQDSVDSGALSEASTSPSCSAEAVPCPALASAGDWGVQAIRPPGEQSMDTERHSRAALIDLDPAQPVACAATQLRPERTEGLPSTPPDEARAVADAVFGELVTLVSLSRSNRPQNASGAIPADNVSVGAFAHSDLSMGTGARYVQTSAARVDDALQVQCLGSAPLQSGSPNYGATPDSMCSASGAGSAFAIGVAAAPRGDASVAAHELAEQNVFAELVAMSTAGSPTQLTAAGGQATGEGFGGSADFAASSSHACDHLDAAAVQRANADQCDQVSQSENSATFLQATTRAAAVDPHATVPAAAPRTSNQLDAFADLAGNSTSEVLASSALLCAAARDDGAV